MNKRRVYALGRDPYWLEAVAAIASKKIEVACIACSSDFSQCAQQLPPPTTGDILLLDATGLANVAAAVRQVHHLGWQRVAVVAADPSWREARAIFLEARAFDYWQKTYASDVIRRSVLEALEHARQEDASPSKQGA